VYQPAQPQMVGTTVLPQQATTSAQQATPTPQQQHQSQQQQPQAQQSHEKAAQSKADETMHRDNAGHQAFNPAEKPSHTAPPPMATFMAHPKAETPHQSNLDKGKQNWHQPSVETPPPTAGLPPTPHTPLPITTILEARPIHDPIRAHNKWREIDNRKQKTNIIPLNRPKVKMMATLPDSDDVPLFASDETQQRDQEGNRKALDDALAAKAAKEKKDASLPGTAGHTRTGSGSSVSTLTSTSSSAGPGPPQVSDPGQPKTSFPTYPPGKEPGERRDIGLVGTPR
jgi:hypothetical protein